MKNSGDINTSAQSSKKESGLCAFLERSATKLRKGPLTCPLCREVFNGIAELGKHMKIHCT